MGERITREAGVPMPPSADQVIGIIDRAEVVNWKGKPSLIVSKEDFALLLDLLAKAEATAMKVGPT